MDEIPAVKLTIHFGDAERYEHHSLSASLLGILREHGLAGATVTRGAMGYGRSRRIYSLMNEVTMTNLPLTIEAVDDAAKVEAALPRLVEMLTGRGIVQVQPTSIVRRPPAREERGEA